MMNMTKCNITFKINLYIINTKINVLRYSKAFIVKKEI